ncbi:MAG: ABC transporter permease, partial [Eubacteriales bacterium]|nr:ABC transporter permease [Eubacteriales bacterium]
MTTYNIPAKKNRQGKEVWRRFKKNRTALVGLILIILILSSSLLADLIVPYNKAIEQSGQVRLQHPNSIHWFGTDHLGRDIFARVVHGSRYSLFIGFFTSIFSLVIGGMIGALCGYYGGRFDNIVMRFMDILMSVPPVLLALAVVAALGANLRNLLIAMTISCVPSIVRLVRSVVLTVADNDYIEVARSYNSSDLRIIIKYVLANSMGPIIVNTTMNIASMILSAAGLSFIGMGVQPPAPEWGSLLSEARQYISRAPYLLYFPGVSILITALSFNLVGDGLRDALDPKLKD